MLKYYTIEIETCIYVFLPSMDLSILNGGFMIICATSKIDDVPIENGGLPHVLLLVVHLNFV